MTLPLTLRPQLKSTRKYNFLYSISPELTYARASSGTYFGVDGLLKTAANNAPRFEYDPVTHEPLGLLMEASATNYLTKSYLLSGWNNNSTASTTDNFYISPDGTQNATQIVVDASNRGRFLQSPGLTAATNYAVSGFVKSYSGGTVIRVGPETTEDVFGNGMITIDTNTGVITGHGTKTYDRYSVLLPNGWTYYKYRVKTGVAQTSLAYVAYSSSAASTYSVWGAQIEAGTRASSYIPTTTTTVTRAADSLYTNSIPWFNPAQGSMMVGFSVLSASDPSYSTILDFSDSSTSNRMRIFDNNIGNFLCSMTSGGGTSYYGSSINLTDNTKYKAALSYKAFASKYYVDAVDKTGTLRSSLVPVNINKLSLGVSYDGDGQLKGHLRSFKYWNRALSDTELKRITT